MEDWAVIMIPIVHKVLYRPGIKILVAYHPDEPKESDAYGYAVIENGMRFPTRERVGRRTEKRMVDAPGPVVHYVYVKQLYRRVGIARALLVAAGVKDVGFIYSCKTGVCSKIERLKSCRWMPLLVRYQKDQVEDDDGI
jgi:GNAT superfamily N-acetyltransferase